LDVSRDICDGGLDIGISVVLVPDKACRASFSVLAADPDAHRQVAAREVDVSDIATVEPMLALHAIVGAKPTEPHLYVGVASDRVSHFLGKPTSSRLGHSDLPLPQEPPKRRYYRTGRRFPGLETDAEILLKFAAHRVG